MSSLEARLTAVFGSLGGSQGGAGSTWELSQTQQVFRSGVDDGSSEDDEYEERARREVVPGEGPQRAIVGAFTPEQRSSGEP